MYYTFLTLFRLLLTLTSYFIYPIAYIFGTKIQNFMMPLIKKDDKNVYQWLTDKKPVYHPYFILWLFLCETRYDYWIGEPWWKLKQKGKWNLSPDVFPKDFLGKLRYFYLSYLWAGSRNAAWNALEFFCTEGQAKGGYRGRVILKGKELKADPHLRWIAKNGHVDNSGDILAFPHLCKNKKDLWKYFWEGKMLYTFETNLGNKRWNYKSAKLYVFKNYYLATERLLGWNWFNGQYIFHFKNSFRKRDEVFNKNYEDYLNWKLKSKQ